MSFPGLSEGASKAEDVMGDQEHLYDPIAIIGMSIRFPEEASSLKGFWDLMMAGRCVSRPFPEDRFSVTGIHHPDQARKDTIALKGGHFLEGDVAAFDASFFSISQTEALSMDPQQRMLLEVSYRALENAGIPMGSLPGSKTGVFTGSFTDDFKTLYQKDVDHAAAYAATGITTTLNANRISWFFDLRGPSINVDTACSSSLVALDQACRSLHVGDSDLGIVTGVNLLLAPDLFYILSGMNMLSPDSRCMSFDQRGNGYGRGEGVGVLIVKRLSDAIKNNDTIRAVIRSSGTNQDGMTPGITQPKQASQEALIRDCYQKAGLDMSRTSYFEAHGTGTPAGDPIEVEAIGAAFRESRDRSEPLIVGAVKSNIGHLEGASGIAGVIKTVLALETGVIPPNADLQQVNIRIDEDFLRIRFPRQSLVWPASGLRRASVNSFGFGGSNAHVVLDDARNFLMEHQLQGFHCSTNHPSKPVGEDPCTQFETEALWRSPTVAQGTPFILQYSASKEERLKELLKMHRTHLETVGDSARGDDLGAYLESLAFTLSERRSRLLWKSFVIADSVQEAAEQLAAPPAPVKSTTRPKIAFIFTGQGAQWARMGIELAAYAVFSNTLSRATDVFNSLGCTWDATAELAREAETSHISEPELSQALCTALQIALVNLLAFFGIHADAVIGHSSGEIAAAYCAGFLSEEAALKIAFMRGVAATSVQAHETYRGTMMATALPWTEAQNLVKSIDPSGALVVACHNSPESTTISGPDHHICRAESELHARGIFARRLKVDLAYHSPQMLLVAEEYRRSIEPVSPRPSQHNSVAMISTVTGKRIGADEVCSAEYWVRNLTSPVKFVQAYEQLLISCGPPKLDKSHLNTVNIDLCVELGPHSTLKGPVRQVTEGITTRVAPFYCAAVERNQSALLGILKMAGQLACHGAVIDIFRVNHGDESRDRFRTLVHLPEYPFDHSRVYWHESRLSQNLRLNQASKLDLLGKRVADWNPLDARWRNHLRISEIPWVEDHKVNGSVIYPAAGMIIMAIEAIKQLKDSATDMAGFQLSDVSFNAALKIPDAGIEVEFSLCQGGEQNQKENAWSTFRLFAIPEGSQWTEICCGYIRTDPKRAPSAFDSGLDLRQSRDHHSSAGTRCDVDVDVEAFYKTVDKCGLNFGPSFRSLKYARHGHNSASGQVDCYHWPGKQTLNPYQPHVVHPCTLDGFIQLPMVSRSKGGHTAFPLLVPHKIPRMWVASRGLSHEENSQVHAATTEISQRSRFLQASISVMNLDMSEKYAEIDGLQYALISAPEPDLASSQSLPNLYNISWKPDIDLVARTDSGAMYGRSKAVEPVDFYRDLTEIVEHTLRKELRNAEDVTSNPHIRKYIRWAKSKIGDAIVEASNIPNADDEERLSKLTAKISSMNAQGLVYATVCQNLGQILRGEADALEVLFSRWSMMQEYYLELSCQGNSFRGLEEYLLMYSHKYPTANYLEIGAGTGGATSLILSYLSYGSGDVKDFQNFSSYHFTDKSPSFFEKAKKKFENYKDVDYLRLDIERDPVAQGFEADSFDVIIAANVLHATTSMANTMNNVHRLLKPGGKLILYEITRPEILRTGFVMGLLPGWWLGTEAHRANGPCMSSNQWSSTLLDNGFSGVDTEFRDFHNEECHELSIMISTKIAKSSKASLDFGDVVIVTHTPNAELVESLDLYCKAAGLGKTNVLPLEDLNSSLPSVTRPLYLIIDQAPNPLLYDIDETTFSAVKFMLTTANSVIWLTTGLGNDDALPASGLVNGLCRVLRNELIETPFITITSKEDIPSKKLCSQIVDIALRSRLETREAQETSYEEHEGVLHISRMVKNYEATSETQVLTQQEVSGPAPFTGGNPLRLSIETPGIIDSLQFTHDEAFHVDLLDDEVEIEVHAIGMNFKDCLIALGQVDGFGLGNEVAGTVTRTGKNGSFKLGDRVVMSTTEGFKTFARGNRLCVSHIPHEMAFTTSAAIPTQFVTAWTSMVEIARLQRGETILIHAGAGGTGQAAIQIAKYLGANVITTVSTHGKKQLLIEEYGISPENILFSRDTTFEQGVRHLTRGRGVDVVLNSLAGDGLLASWACLAPYGRFVEIGKRDILANANLPMSKFNDSTSFAAFDGSIWMTERPEKAQAGISTILDLFEKGTFRPASPLHVHDISEFRSVFRDMANGRNIGKAVFSISEQSIVPARVRLSSNYKLNAEKTYIIAGGLGGVGRSIAEWMVGRGARNLLLLSRSGDGSETAARFTQRLHEMAEDLTILAPPCDISSFAELSRTITASQLTMPPIGGCIQASMVLRDATFANCSYAEWSAATAPKVAGSWNLHRLLPSALDFFILLSSVSGIVGQHGQSNYASGNTYMDELARFRSIRGQKAVSIALGALVSDGVLAEDGDRRQRFLTATGGAMVPLSRAHVLALMEKYCDPNATLLAPQESQVIIGINTPRDILARGRDVPQWMYTPFFRSAHGIISADAGKDKPQGTEGRDLRKEFLAISDISQATRLVAQSLATRLARTFGAQSSDEIDLNTPLTHLGVESLLAVELRTWLGREFKADVAVFDILGKSSCWAIGTMVAKQKKST